MAPPFMEPPFTAPLPGTPFMSSPRWHSQDDTPQMAPPVNRMNQSQTGVKHYLAPTSFQSAKNHPTLKKMTYIVTELIIGGSRGGVRDARPPPGRPNSFDFMQFSGKFGVFTPPLEGSRPPSGKSWIRHCSLH